jgi:hypothetical protein
MIIIYLIHQVNHKGSPENGGSGQKFLIELEDKLNGSQGLHH